MTAAALPLVFITLSEALCDRARVAPGETVLIHAGAGGTGHIGVQLAKLRGARVATTVSSERKAKLAQKLGADLVIPYHDRDFVAANPIASMTDNLSNPQRFYTVLQVD